MKLPSYQELSKEQDAINNLPLDESFLVIGPPGTGKTVMALYRASMLNKRKEDVFVLMHSRLLMQYTKSGIGALKIDGMVDTFHHWLYSFFKGKFSLHPPSIAKWVYDWPEIFRLLSAKPCAPGSLPHLIVDEGQDLPPNFYFAAKYLARRLTVFADENQRIQKENSTLKDIKIYGPKSVHKLTRNYRNTKEIAALASAFATGLESGVAAPPTKSGDAPLLLRHQKLHMEIDYIVRFERSRPDLDIGILVPTKEVQKQFVNRLEGKTTNSVQAYLGGKGGKAAPIRFDTPGIKVVCYQSAKGLEFDAVFLPSLQTVALNASLPEFRMLYFVLLSRAREHLTLSYCGDDRPSLLSQFPLELLDCRE
jgi:superfamily I DNA/RNA helicase